MSERNTNRMFRYERCIGLKYSGSTLHSDADGRNILQDEPVLVKQLDDDVWSGAI